MSRTVRIALVQQSYTPFERDANLAKAEAAIRQAASDGANLVCLPEMFLTGYPMFRGADGKLRTMPHVPSNSIRTTSHGANSRVASMGQLSHRMDPMLGVSGKSRPTAAWSSSPGSANWIAIDSTTQRSCSDPTGGTLVRTAKCIRLTGLRGSTCANRATRGTSGQCLSTVMTCELGSRYAVTASIRRHSAH